MTVGKSDVKQRGVLRWCMYIQDPNVEVYTNFQAGIVWRLYCTQCKFSSRAWKAQALGDCLNLRAVC